MNLMQQIQLMQRLMKDENFKAFMAHPKVQEVFKDPEFQKVIQSKDAASVMQHPKLLVLKDDPEIAVLISKLDFRGIFGGESDN